MERKGLVMTREEVVNVMKTVNYWDLLMVQLESNGGEFSTTGHVWGKDNGDYMVGDSAIYNQEDAHYPSGGPSDRVKFVQILERNTDGQVKRSLR